MDHHVLSHLVTLLLISCFVAIIAQWFRQPYTIALVIVGMVVALTKLTPSISLTEEVTFTIILPPLLFYGALHMDLQHMKENWKSIALLAVPGVVVSTFLVGAILNQFWPVDFMTALLFGALITPTDPISVLAILKKVGAPKRLRVMLEGESLFNDGTGVVVFAVILSLVLGHSEFSLTGTVSKFFMVAIGGTVIGFLCGFLAYQALKKINDHLLEVSITVVLAFGTPLLAEHFHCSGIIAVVVAGLIMGNYGKLYSMSTKTRETVETFWETIDFIINSLLFLIIGIELQVINHESLRGMMGLIGIAIGAVLVSRLIVVYPVVYIRNLMSQDKIPFQWSHVIFWGGLKGSIPLALVAGLPESFVHRELFLTVAFGIVVFSLLVQGLTMSPLINRLGLSQKNA